MQRPKADGVVGLLKCYQCSFSIEITLELEVSFSLVSLCGIRLYSMLK